MVLPNRPVEDRTYEPGFHPDGINPQHLAVGISQRLSKDQTIEKKQQIFQQIAEAINANPKMDLAEAKEIHWAVYQVYFTVHGTAIDAQAEALLALIEDLYPDCVPDVPD